MRARCLSRTAQSATPRIRRRRSAPGLRGKIDIGHRPAPVPRDSFPDGGGSESRCAALPSRLRDSLVVGCRRRLSFDAGSHRAGRDEVGGRAIRSDCRETRSSPRPVLAAANASPPRLTTAGGMTLDDHGGVSTVKESSGFHVEPPFPDGAGDPLLVSAGLASGRAEPWSRIARRRHGTSPPSRGAGEPSRATGYGDGRPDRAGSLRAADWRCRAPFRVLLPPVPVPSVRAGFASCPRFTASSAPRLPRCPSDPARRSRDSGLPLESPGLARRGSVPREDLRARSPGPRAVPCACHRVTPTRGRHRTIATVRLGRRAATRRTEQGGSTPLSASVRQHRDGPRATEPSRDQPPSSLRGNGAGSFRIVSRRASWRRPRRTIGPRPICATAVGPR